MPAGGEQVEALAKKVEGMKKQLKDMGSRVRSPSVPPRSRSPRRFDMFGLPYKERPVSASTSRAMVNRDFMPFRAPSLDTFAGVAAKHALFGDARVAAICAALRGRRLT